MSGGGRTVAHAIQCHFCNDIVDIAHAQQADGSLLVALCATGEVPGVSERFSRKEAVASSSVVVYYEYRVSRGVGTCRDTYAGMGRMAGRG